MPKRRVLHHRYQGMFTCGVGGGYWSSDGRVTCPDCLAALGLEAAQPRRFRGNVVSGRHVGAQLDVEHPARTALGWGKHRAIVDHWVRNPRDHFTACCDQPVVGLGGFVAWGSSGATCRLGRETQSSGPTRTDVAP